MALTRPLTRAIKRNTGMSFKWNDGQSRSTVAQLPITPVADEATKLTAFYNAVNALTNSAMVEERLTTANKSTVPSEQTVFDESYGLAYSLVMNFVTTSGVPYPIEIPAPDQSIVAGGEIDLGNSLVEGARDSYIALFPSGIMNFTGAYIATRKVKGRIGSGTLPVIAEPEVGQNPPDAPATN